MAATESFKKDWLEAANENTQNLEDTTGSNSIPLIAEDEIDDCVVMPCLKYESDQLKTPVGYRRAPMSTFFNPIRILRDTVNGMIEAYDTLKGETEQARDDANTAAENASGIWNTVKNWFNGTNGFKATSEAWIADTKTAWNNWFSDSLATGVRKLWNDFWSSINTSWNGFFGTSADDANGVRKIWSNWFAGAQNQHSQAEQNRQADYNQKEAARQQTFENTQNNRQQAYVTSEEQRQSTFNQTQTARQNDYTQKEAARQTDYEQKEAARQQNFETNETQRQNDFEAAESERMSAMLLTHFVVDPETMIAYAIKPALADISYSIHEDDGIMYANLNIGN